MVANVKHNNACPYPYYYCVWIDACMCRFTNCALHALFHRPLPLLHGPFLLLFLLSILISSLASLSSFILISFPLDCIVSLISSAYSISYLCFSFSSLSLHSPIDQSITMAMRSKIAAWQYLLMDC
jgi:hypothetical protein